MLQFSQFDTNSTVPYVKEQECIKFENNEKNLFPLTIKLEIIISQKYRNLYLCNICSAKI